MEDYSSLKWKSNLKYIPIPRSNSDKIILPQSVLESLLNQSAAASSSSQLPSPLCFRLTNPVSKKVTHVGVREFSAPEGSVLVPESVAHGILDLKSDDITAEFVLLPKATSLRLQPVEEVQDESYGVIDWKVMLEAQLNNTYTALTKGDILTVSDPIDADKSFQFLIENVEPQDAVCIVDTDVDLEVLHKYYEEQPSSSNFKPSFPTEVSEGTTSLKLEPGQSVKMEIKCRPQFVSVRHNAEQGSVAAFIGTTNQTSVDNFKWSTLLGDQVVIDNSSSDNGTDNDDPSQYSNFWVTLTSDFKASVSLTISEKVPDHEGSSAQSQGQEQGSSGNKKCDNCKQFVPEQSYQLHTTFCARNNKLCECGLVYRQQLPESHWHCLEHQVRGDSEYSKSQHDAFFHQLHNNCGCGKKSNSSRVALAHHRAKDCPKSLHICRFCHLLLPREEASPIDVLEGLSGHESQCGNKTTDCDRCGRAIRLREMESHLQIHNYERLSTPKPVRCKNINCARLAGKNSNHLGLCDFCYGPLHSSMQDNEARLKARIERRYVIQLTRGCSNGACMNQYCARNLGKMPMAQVMATIKNIPDFAFCVDEMTTKRKTFVDLEQTEYSPEWTIAAIEATKGNEQKARVWLENNAVKRAERVETVG